MPYNMKRITYYIHNQLKLKILLSIIGGVDTIAK